jgi:Ca2+-binding RTX toxin-like protein
MSTSSYPFGSESYTADTRVTQADLVTTQNFAQKQSELLAALKLDYQTRFGTDSAPSSSLLGSGVWNHYGTLGNDVLVGTAISDFMFGFSGRDNISGGKGNDFIYPGGGGAFGDGGEGVDTLVFEKALSSYTINPQSYPKSGGVIYLSIITKDLSLPVEVSTFDSIERLQFSDTHIALDVNSTQNAGSVYMLYKAAFNRAPDAGGMGFWLAQKDNGKNIITDLAQGFVNSDEFIGKYGTNPTNASYVDKLYQNVLGRAGDAGGVAYWNQQLDAGNVSKAAVLVAFATLPEGASIVAPLIANGIAYTEWVG